jgi:hexosaminidase
MDRNIAQILAAGMTPIVWEEMAIDWNLTLSKDTVIQTWLSTQSLSTITSKGFKAIFGNYDAWYLDCGTGGWMNIPNSGLAANYPFADWCGPVKNWRLIYDYDPLAGLSAEQAALVVGGEIHIWSEQTDPSNWDTMVWPRASAAGEVMWSGRQDASGITRSQLNAGPRLNEWRERMVARGISCAPAQMIFCSQADATECSV